MKKFVVHSHNQALLDAFFETCKGLSIPIDSKWNKTMKDKDSLYITPTKVDNHSNKFGLGYFSHECGGVTHTLPQDWDSALEVAKLYDYEHKTYTGPYKVGDTISVSQLRLSLFYSDKNGDWVSDTAWAYDREITMIEYKNGRWTGKLSRTDTIWIDLSSIPDKKLTTLIEKSGLKIGDLDTKKKLSGKKYRSNKWDIDKGWSTGFISNENCKIIGFEYHCDEPCVKVEYLSSNHIYYFPLNQEFGDPAIQIAGYFVEVNKSAKVVQFGCRAFNKRDLQAYGRLLEISEADVMIKIGVTEVTLKTIQELISLIEK